MDDLGDPGQEEMLDAYLDDALKGRERAEFERRLAQHLNLQRSVAKQRQIDDSLRRLFAVGAPDVAAIAAKLTDASPSEAAKLPLPRSKWAWAAIVTAAAVLSGILASAWTQTPERIKAHFEARPLAELYAAAVADGFEPYYDCREPGRFSEIFARRLGQPLRLLPLPKNVRMLGLSYPGGLSPDTTAMLCRVEERPVMVFVDRAPADNALAAANHDRTTNVFREERDGLVFYEITPLNHPLVTRFLVKLGDEPSTTEAKLP
jgi:hypothetical protein